MFQKYVLKIGITCFFVRLILCAFLVTIELFSSAQNEPIHTSNMMPPYGISLGFISAIVLGIGACTDLVLIFGAQKKCIGAIWFWNISQIFIGGGLFCIFISITMKEIEDIKKGNLIEGTLTVTQEGA